MTTTTERPAATPARAAPTPPRGFVEFSFDAPGLDPFVTHKFASASKGTVGLVQAGEVATPEGGAAH